MSFPHVGKFLLHKHDERSGKHVMNQAWKEQADIADKLYRAASDKVLKYLEQIELEKYLYVRPDDGEQLDAATAALWIIDRLSSS